MSASDEPRAEVCSVCGMDPLDRRGEGEVCTACGGGIASEDGVLYRCALRSGMSEEGARRYIQRQRDHKKRDAMWEQIGDLLTDENVPILAAVLAEVAQMQAGQGIFMARYNTLSDYNKRIRDAAAAIVEALKFKAGDI